MKGKLMVEGEIRKPVISDLPQISQIEQSTFPEPWSQDIFLTIILRKGRMMIDHGNFINLCVMDYNHEVIGYVVWEEMNDEQYGHLLNIAVREDFRSRGHGKALLNFVFSRMRDAGMKTCGLEVRESNQIARNLYSKAGMMAVDKVHGYYDGEDAIICFIEF
jgi:ribosomal-protein-alanine N-acetyltransferase